MPADDGVPVPDWRHRGLTLMPEQREVADGLTAAIGAGGFHVTLLDGVTGAGKTEVYLEAVAEAVKAGRQALVMLPEIALTAP